MKILKPNRISHSYTQTINGSVKEIMPLYCPVRELDWIERWDAKEVYTNSGYVEDDCIFTTSHGDDDLVWIVTDYDINKGHVEMYYVVPDLMITRLEIQLTPLSGKTTNALITYTKTSISEKGDKALKLFTKEQYEHMMLSWEKSMNHYLETGQMLKGLPEW